MGYCSRCGEITNIGKCRKCGGRPVASIATNLAIDTIESPTSASPTVADRWQSQYANSILGPRPTSSISSPVGFQRPSLRKIYGDDLQQPQQQKQQQEKQQPPSFQCCSECHKKEYVSIRFEGRQQKRYLCDACEPRSDASTCTSCQGSISETDRCVLHKTSAWHSDCFRCQTCHRRTLDAVNDDGAVCSGCDTDMTSMADSFLLRQARGARRISIPSFTPPTPPLCTSPASTTSRDSASPVQGSVGRYFLEGSLSKGPPSSIARGNTGTWNRPRIDSHLFHHYQKSLATSQVSSVSVPPVEKLPEPTQSTPHVREEEPCVQEKPTSPLQKECPEKPRSKDKKKPRTCTACSKPLRGGGRRIKVPVNDGSDDCMPFHFDCLRCTACHDHFPNLAFVRDGQGIFHPECRPKREPQCVRCHKAIAGKILTFDNRLFHPECFTCFKCDKVLPSSQPFYDVHGQAHCDACLVRPVVSASTPIPAGRGGSGGRRRRDSMTLPDDTNVSPSHILMNRTRALPKLGGSKKCPRCEQSVPVTDDIQGPRVSHWHRKCLACAKCKKPMDSSAKVTVGDKGEWLVHCRDCMDNRPKPNFVRR
ncbi:hypothetical protein BCR43DRAFT_262360 [Syncephalastrum racemosum]|uniref:LIM zinc-binding domain-containing protein n=1 Tax=Syncephalastrum racemosum TaxID=13706 RepID=A0A1X2HGU8_SYNRA|nr:hypothetical protein BCR43DRAFT_262360 [Syncephalastrum racemosum]